MKNGPYILVLAPETYPGKKYRGKYCYEHTLVWWTQYSQLPPENHEIHHLDGDHTNNSISNLQCLPKKEHRLIHSQLKAEKAKKELTCTQCGQTFFISLSKYKFRIKQNSTGNLYCSRQCSYDGIRIENR